MLRKKITLLAAAMATTTALATPAHALFGFTCIPTLYNCMCTYRVPCPVSDPQTLAQNVIQNSQVGEKLSLLKDLKKPGTEMLMAMTGEVPYGLPGIGSIGIDLNGIMNGNLASLGIPSLGGDLVSQLNNFGIDGNLLSSIASGELGVSDFMNVAEAAGLDTSMLEQAGLGLDQITALASGDLSISGVLDLAKTLNLEAGVLADIGITEDLLVGISQGNIDPGRVLQIAQNAGLNIPDLASVGLTAETIMNLPNAGPDFVASVLQNSGFDSSIVTSLGLDAGMIAQISSGQLPPQAIETLVQGTGIDPSSITLPGVNGPIRVTDLVGSNVPQLVNSAVSGAIDANVPQEISPLVSDVINSATTQPAGSGMGGADISDPAAQTARPSNINDTITIPTSSVPGLNNALNAASGTTPATGLFTGSDANTAAMCAADKSLISVSEAPNGFGDDVENIHMAISGGTLEVFEEAVDAASSVGASTSAFAYGRSMQIRPILVKAMEAVETFDEMIAESKTYQDDIIINDTIKGQLMTARAETASVYTSLTSLFASTQMSRKMLDPVPVFPETAKWRDMVVQANQEIESAQQSGRVSSQAATVVSSMQDYTDVRNSSREALNDYSLIQYSNQAAAFAPSLEETIDIHETHKNNLYSLEEIIRSALLTLYGPDDADTAWEILHPQLLASAGTYENTGKWQQGYQRAIAYSTALTAQTAQTSYGSRVLVTPQTRDTPPVYSTIGYTPSRYSHIDSYASSQGDPYSIVSMSYSSGSDDDSGPPPGQQLVGVLQYYFETARREAWNGELRRGDAARMMTGSFWNEMLYHAPECLSGPIPVSPTALVERPDMFDLDKNCEHLYWSGGDEGDYIDASHLGGADAALWTSKITRDRVALMTGGPDQVMEDLQAALDALNSGDAVMLLQMAGNTAVAEHADQLQAALEQALASTDFTQAVSYPQ